MADVATSGNRPAGTGIVFRDPLPWPEQRELVRTAEETGYIAAFVPETAAREAFSTLTAIADDSSRIRVGAGVVPMWARTPATTAMAAATVQERSDGRFVLGLGSGSPPPGSTPRKQLGRLRQYVASVRTILAGESLPPDDPFGQGGFKLALELPTGPPPIWLGALGDRTLRAAGGIADGVILNWCTPKRVREAREMVGADLTVAVYVRACLGVGERVALEALRLATAHYAAIPHYRRQMERMGFGDAAATAAEAFASGDLERVPETLVRTLTVMGGRDEALARFAAFHDAGADLVLVYPVPALDPFSSVMGTLLTAAPDPTFG
jgi:alkanesulfonate monooxygenase SsuD/methylene tetrahydromethanopterin reductase-like flavin-dependent oxidoreductase (luciferase family)